MSPEHLATIRGIYDAMNRRDLDTLRELGMQLSDFTWESSLDEVDAHGRLDSKASLAYSRELFELFDELQTDIEQTIDLGPDQAILVVHHHMRGAASGARVDRREAHLWTVRDDRVESLREYRTVEEAREAAGAS